MAKLILKKMKGKNTFQGFSMVEVLVSIIILSFAVLGMARIQGASLQSNRDARLQSAAVVLASDLAESIRGNKVEGIKQSSNPYLGSFESPLEALTPSFCLNVAEATVPCASTNDIANAQITEWLSRVDETLPGARVDICFDESVYDTDGMPVWDCSDSGEVLVIKIGWTQNSKNSSLSGDDALERATVPRVIFPITAGSAL